MKKIYTLIVFLVTISANAQELLWKQHKAFAGSASDDIVDIAYDNGYTYVAGSFGGTVDFNQGGTVLMERTATSQYDAYVAKYASDGECVWVVTVPATSFSIAKAVAIDATGVYFGGHFSGSATFGFAGRAASGLQDIFFAKVDFNGNFIWENVLQNASGLDEATLWTMQSDKNGNLFVGGSFNGSLDADDDNFATDFKVSNLNNDIFLGKYSSIDGSYLWSKSMGGSGNDEIYKLDVTQYGEVVAGGFFSGDTDFDNDFTDVNNLTPIGSGFVDGFVVTYYGDGTFQWVRQLGSGTSHSYVLGLSYDGISNMYITGSTGFDGIDYDLSGGVNVLSSGQSNSLFVAKYDIFSAPEAPAWVKVIGSAAAILPYNIDTDGNRVIVGGYFDPGVEVDFHPGPEVDPKTSVGEADGFWSVYDAQTGTYERTNTFNNNENATICQDVEVSGDQIFATAYYFGELTLENGIVLNNTNTWDSYVVSYEYQQLSRWQTRASLNFPRYYHSAAAANGKIYVMGGADASALLQIVEEYDPVTDQWSYLGIPQMPSTRFVPAAVTVNNKIYVIGGCLNGDCSTGVTGLVEKFDPALGQWSQLPDMPLKRIGMVTVAVGTKIYVIGGQDCNVCDPSPIIQVLDTQTDQWETTPLSGMPVPIAFGAAGEINGEIYVTAGTKAGFMYSLNSYKYSPDLNEWTDLGAMALPTEAPAFGVINNELYVVSGWEAVDVPTNRSLAFTPGIGWREEEAIPTARYFGASAVLGDKLYVIGSDGASNVGGVVEAYTVPITFDEEPAGQPEDYFATNITHESYDITLVEGDFGADGYLVVRAEGDLPSFVPQDGFTYSVGNVPGGTISHVGASTSFSESGLQAETTYYYYVYAYNGTGDMTNYRQASPLYFAVTTAVESILAEEPTAQPTNLIFTNRTLTRFDFNFTVSDPPAEGYIGLRKTGSSPSTPPVDGVTYAVGETIGDAVVFFLGSGVSWFWDNAQPSTNYHLDVYAYNGTGTATNYLTVNPLEGDVTTLSPDNTPPTFANVSAPFTNLGQEVVVEVEIEDEQSGIIYNEIWYAPTEDVDDMNDFIGGQQLTDMGNNRYRFTIPAQFNTEMGVSFYVYAENGSYDPDDSNTYATSPVYTIRAEVTGEGLQIPFTGYGSQMENYRIVAFPFVGSTTTTVGSVLDELGPNNKEAWRMFHYVNASRTDELTTQSSLQPQLGYWLLVKESKNFRSGGIRLSGASFDQPVTIQLQAGWNQIGNPYTFNISWNDVLAASGLANAPQMWKQWNGGWMSNDVLQAFTGAFVFANSPVTLKILPFKRPNINTGREDQTPSNGRNKDITSQEWQVDLNLRAGDVVHQLSGIGMNPNAAEDLDHFDDVNLPRFVNYLEVRHNKQAQGYNLSRDIVPTAQNHVWDFAVESDSPDDKIEITWDNSAFNAGDVELVLWDVAQQMQVDMRTNKSYVFNKKNSHLFKILFGSHAFVQENSSVNTLVLHPASPNPAAEAVNFSFNIPQSLASENTVLEVYDLLGHKVSTVVNEKLEAGFHQAKWNGLSEDSSRPAAGVYIALLKSGNNTQTCRLILK